ncbi:hypothetical protein JG687_00003236 [Phytophthora cactorum]|uniref:NAD(P)-binding domain n=1 Tax=Phytophthora cactorum TaxID=29920 RepID=A0A8T1UW97_9STRA|nr:hypothetical protein JG687_00003236 [Phytophthora cactorum]
MVADLWWVGVLVAGVVVGVSVVSFVVTKLRAPGFKVEGKHVFITGGSSGLGLALAKKYAQQGAKVSIVARGLDKLEKSKTEIEGVRKNADAGVFIQSCDVADFASVQKAVDAANKFHGRVTDHVYAAPKYALRGLAESLRNELKLFGIRVSIFYPGNIDSPGFVEENRTKPPETKTIEGVSEPLHPDKVAQSLINGVSDGQFSITNDPMIFILRVLANGVAPRSNTMMETVMLPLLIPIQVGFGFFMDFIVWQTKRAREKKPKDQ